MKKAENKNEVLIRDHKDEIEQLTLELTESSKKTHEELLLKFQDERSKLIQESNKSNDSKYTELKEKFDQLQKDRDELEAKLTQTIADMNSQKELEIKELHT